MQALFVHGMGRSPLSAWRLLRHLQHAGLKTCSFGYSVSLEDVATIERRLVARIARLAERGDYVLIGHSLGGVLLRAAINSLPAATRRPRHLFLLGSPLRPALLAQRLAANPLYRVLTRDCGQLLGSAARMAEIGPVPVPTTGIVGVRGLPPERSPFRGEANDGVVSIAEVSADWLGDQVQVPIVHTFLPSSRRVADIILQRLARNGEKGG